jgi:hypothetical protein
MVAGVAAGQRQTGRSMRDLSAKSDSKHDFS